MSPSRRYVAGPARLILALLALGLMVPTVAGAQSSPGVAGYTGAGPQAGQIVQLPGQVVPLGGNGTGGGAGAGPTRGSSGRSGPTTGTLPFTGLQLGGMALAALALLALGLALRRVADQRPPNA